MSDTEPENELPYILATTFNEEALVGYERSEVKQGYHPNGWRYRQEDEHYTQNRKEKPTDGSYTWDEEEADISADEFDAMWPDCEDKLTKTRYTREIEDETIHIDFFKDPTGETYIIKAEITIPKDRIEPKHIPPEMADKIIYQPHKDDLRFTAKSLANIDHAKKLLEDIAKDTLPEYNPG